MTNFDDFKLAVEALSGGRNTVILDDIGMPSVVVPFSKLLYSDVITGGTAEPLPAFVVGDKTIDVIDVSKYINIVVNDRAYSLPMKDPAVNINFDRAVQVCRNKGNGWHLMTNALWAAIALWCKKNGTMPHGNNNYGSDINYPHEKGVPTSDVRTATGSGPSTWYHNYDTTGIADMKGDTWEWMSGLRLNGGEINIIPNGNAMLSNCDMSANSAAWKAILEDGTLVAPGTADTLKYDWQNNKITLAKSLTTQAGGETNFKNLALASGVTAPPLIKALGLFPDGTGYDSDNVWVAFSGENMPLRGGSVYFGKNTGMFALNISNTPSFASDDAGFRSAHYKVS